jgi:Leucine-rich repeat (LRR) protein
LCDNRLESIDISRLPKLREINLSNNRLTILDVSQNPALEKLDIRSNKITANLSIFSHLTNLKELKLGGIFAKKNKVV